MDFTGQTPFLRAALSGDVTVMRLLLEKGADPNIPTNSNTTRPDGRRRSELGGGADLHGVERSSDGSGEAVRFEKGEDVNAKNTHGSYGGDGRGESRLGRHPGVPGKARARSWM